MINQKLLSYFEQQTNAGYDLERLSDYLIKQGYNPNDVNDTAAYFASSQLKQINKGILRGDLNMAKKATVSKASVQAESVAKEASVSGGVQQYAGFWIRFLAYILDGLILGIPTIIVSLVLVLVTKIPSLQYLVSLVMIVVIVYMDGTLGGTPGKLILGLRIVNEQGKYIGVPMAILRYIGRILSAIILWIGFLMIVWDPKKQGLHDKIAKTYVVKK